MRPRLLSAGLVIKAVGFVLFLLIVNGITSLYLPLHRNRKSIKSVLTNVLPKQSSDPNIDLAGTYKKIFKNSQSNWTGNDPHLKLADVLFKRNLNRSNLLKMFASRLLTISQRKCNMLKYQYIRGQMTDSATSHG